MVKDASNRPSSIIIAGANNGGDESIRQAVLHVTITAANAKCKAFGHNIRHAFSIL
jgi:hypothetical protein